MKTLWELFWAFFRIGLFTFGGGYAMLPLIQKEVVEVKGWAKDEEVLDFYAIGQSTPGIIAINTATFVGYKVKKLKGAMAATIGMVIPSLIIIMVIATFFTRFQEYEVVQNAFMGIRAAVCAILVNSIYKMGKKAIVDKIGILIAVVAFIFISFINISPIFIVIGTAICGILLRYRREK
ncbi:chromate transporter [Clostridium sediminicola]|uniref:chromate transporter n=1 Tax=Clostridium sediminicola TaxID=3114879 RepID=UPI0031F26FE6